MVQRNKQTLKKQRKLREKTYFIKFSFVIYIGLMNNLYLCAILLLCIPWNVGYEESGGAVGAYQHLVCVLRSLCEQRTEPFALGILLQLLEAHLRLFNDRAIGSQAIEEVARVNVYCPCYLVDGGQRRVARNHLRHGSFGHAQSFCHLHGGESLAVDGLHDVQLRNGSVRLDNLVSVFLYLDVYHIYCVLCCL